MDRKTGPVLDDADVVDSTRLLVREEFAWSFVDVVEVELEVEVEALICFVVVQGFFL